MALRELYMVMWLQQRSGAASHHPNIKGQAEVATLLCFQTCVEHSH